jgi:hypothetical protein
MLNRSKSHYSASLSYPAGYNSRDLPAHRAAREERKVQQDKLKELGFKTQYFEFRDGDEAAKARAKAHADRVAEHWSEKTGFKFDVSEGFFLGFGL